MWISIACGGLASMQPHLSYSVENKLSDDPNAGQLKVAALIHATRVAVTGRAVSAGLFDVLVLLGPSRVSRRLRRAHQM